MNKFDATKRNMAQRIVLESIGPNRHLIDKMKQNDEGTFDVILTVGGVQLDFDRFAEVIEKQLEEFIEGEAQALLDKKYADLVCEIEDIQERIQGQKEKFKYDWEETK